MNFCSNCGSSQLRFEIPGGDHYKRHICSDCDTIHYSNPNMIVGCIVEYDGKIVLARRGIEPRLGFWNLPCGFMENNETAEEGAIREVKEETAMDVEIKGLHVVYSVPDSNQVYLIYRASCYSPYYELTEESSEIKFFAKDDIPWSEIAFSSNTFALQKYLESGGLGDKVFTGSYRKIVKG